MCESTSRYSTPGAAYSSPAVDAAVFPGLVRLVFAAVQHHAPDRAQTESVKGFSVVRGGELRLTLRPGPAQIVVASGKHRRYFAAGDLSGHQRVGQKLFRGLAVVMDIPVDDEKVHIPE